MNKHRCIQGLALFGVGLLTSSLSSFLSRYAVLGGATDLVNGVLVGLSVIAYGVSILLLRSQRGAGS
ncbi:MAG: hypothetical protein JXA74_12750 [Anaerolineae bacterium]|nr:hypothetical protein [Anaerolineae bacterium]